MTAGLAEEGFRLQMKDMSLIQNNFRNETAHWPLALIPLFSRDRPRRRPILYSVMATEIPLKVSYCQQTALYLSCPVIILSPHFHLKEMSGYYKLCHVRRHPLLQTLLPLSAGGFLRTRTRRPCRPTGTGGSG